MRGRMAHWDLNQLRTPRGSRTNLSGRHTQTRRGRSLRVAPHWSAGGSLPRRAGSNGEHPARRRAPDDPSAGAVG
jgi:hypothetical protein